MRNVVAAIAGVALGLFINQSQPLAQQQCGPCATAPTVDACVKCSRQRNPGNWTEDGMTGWCVRNMPACREKK